MDKKTNAMRLLDQAAIVYLQHSYPFGDGKIDGLAVADKIGRPYNQVYKTLVTKGTHNCYVFVLPVNHELDLKAAARSVNEKSVEMLAVKDLLGVTGYVRGGCSPLGMKKLFVTVFDEAIMDLPTVIISAGRLGTQIELAPIELLKLVNGHLAAIIKK